MQVGHTVSTDAFTNYDTLGELIRKFNAAIAHENQELIIDETIVLLRDAIAHGRVWGDSPIPPFYLVKFGKPRKTDNNVPVTFSEKVTLEWINIQIERVLTSVHRVYQAGRNRYPDTFVDYVSPA